MAVTVMVEVVRPSAAALVGLAVAVEADALTGPRTKLTDNEAEFVAEPTVAIAVLANFAVTVAVPRLVVEVRFA